MRYTVDKDRNDMQGPSIKLTLARDQDTEHRTHRANVLRCTYEPAKSTSIEGASPQNNSSSSLRESDTEKGKIK